jgi:hypothetical protein
MQPCHTDLDNFKSSLASLLTLINDEATQFNKETHLIHLGLNPNLCKKKTPLYSVKGLFKVEEKQD